MLAWFETIHWAHPWWFLGLFLPLLWLGIRFWQHQRRKALPLPESASLTPNSWSWKVWLYRSQPWLRFLAMSAVVVALARPRTSHGEESVKTDAIDIMLALDVSTSMDAMDFEPNRLVAAKQTAAAFIDLRPNDRIGLVVFSEQAFTQCPLTTDHNVLKLLLNGVQQGWLDNGTAIGLGLAQCILRLKDSETLSKVVILLTDGENNRYQVNPLDAMQLARQFGVRVYTIGMGTNGYAAVPKTDFAGNTKLVQELVQIDEELLREIAEETGGQYFRATDLQDLQGVYDEIDRLEKTTLEVSRFVRYEEWYWPLACLALALIMLELLIRHALARSFPDT